MWQALATQYKTVLCITTCITPTSWFTLAQYITQNRYSCKPTMNYVCTLIGLLVNEPGIDVPADKTAMSPCLNGIPENGDWPE